MTKQSGRWPIALAGAVALAVAMGIGRFAFTPLLPLMLADGAIDLASASWLASANYFGYLAGALLCTLQPWLWARLRALPPIHAPTLARAGLVATCVLTLGMAVPLSAAWPLLRFAAGVASAIVFVYGAGWCMARLTAMGASALAGVIFTGPGAGIVLSGLSASAMVALQVRASSGWSIFGMLAVLMTAAVWAVFRDADRPTRPNAAGAAAPAAQSSDPGRAHGRLEIGLLAFAYGLAGFGYIITATFLPVIARQALPGSPLLDLFWPLFGLAIVIGALLSTRVPASGDRRHWLTGAYLMQAAGVAASLLSPTQTGFALGSLLLGLPFTAITFFAMQEVRRLRPALAAAFTGLLTATYGIGQIAGPPLVALLLRGSRSVGAGFTLSLQIACAGLVAGALIYQCSARAYPIGPGVRF